MADEPNVINFSEAQLRQLQGALRRGAEPQAQEKVRLINEAVSGLLNSLGRKYKFMVAEDASKPPYLVRVDAADVVYPASEQVLVDAAYGEYHQAYGRKDVDDIATNAKRALRQPDVLLRSQEIAPFRWKDEPGLCHCRMPFERQDYLGEMPATYREFMDRIRTDEERFSFILWVGSVFDLKQSDRSQYLYIHGEGEDGKSSLIYAVGSLFGRGHLPIDSQTLSARFGTSALEGVRFLELADSNAASFVSTTLFKRITGERKLNVEQKKEPLRVIPLHCMTAVTSNFPPQSQGNRADERRLVYVRVKRFEGKVDRSVAAAYETGAGDFVRYCDTVYRWWRMDHPNDEIPVGKEAQEAVKATSVRAEAEEIFNSLFATEGIDKTLFLVAADVREDIAKAAKPYRKQVELETIALLRERCGNATWCGSRGKGYFGIQRV